MSDVTSTQTILHAERVSNISADEAAILLHTEIERSLAPVESFGSEDWTQTTACTALTVRDILAHQAVGYASDSSYKEMIHQYMRIPQKSQLPEDAIN